MINAGVKIKTFNGLQRWSPEESAWAGISVEVVYPEDQTAEDNPVSVGDKLIETNGNVWEVTSALQDDHTKKNFLLTLRLDSGEPTEDVNPSFGTTTRGGIITPINGFIAPYWDTQMVGAEVGRIASYMTMKNATLFWNGDVPGVNLADLDDTE